MNGTSATEMQPGSLRAALDHEPRPLKFGTSGRRGEVLHLTQLEIYLNALAELEYLQSLPSGEGGIRKGDEFYYARDLRPSASAFVPEQGNRGEIAQAIEQAIRDAGMTPVNLGRIPTPALTCHALAQGKGSIMVTGSHIPFDRNGYKTNTARGELLKKDEAPIEERVAQVRARLYNQPFTESPFDQSGRFKAGHRDLSPGYELARKAYTSRYLEFFGDRNFKDWRVLVYQHSAVGRDVLVAVLEGLGATTIPMGRSETFVPIDTENVDDTLLATIQAMLDKATAEHGSIDAIVSTDGDSDRPLILGVEGTAEGPKARFFGGDLVGMVVAEYLEADAVVVPISCNDAIDRGILSDRLEPKTRIGSPYVIAGMEQARRKGRQRVCGWEANGGFLTGSDIQQHGRTLKALPTRDAMLPILGTLLAAKGQRVSLVELFSRLPKRFSKAALLKNFPRPASCRIIERFLPGDENIREAEFAASTVQIFNASAKPGRATDEQAARLAAIRAKLREFFPVSEGFGPIARINYTDGLRIYFDNGEVAHIRPSGNADELRIYAVADRADRAEAIARLGVAEPDGILRRLEKALG